MCLDSCNSKHHHVTPPLLLSLSTRFLVIRLTTCWLWLHQPALLRSQPNVSLSDEVFSPSMKQTIYLLPQTQNI